MSSASLTAHPAKFPCLIAASVFAALAALIGWLASAPLGAADLVGISACAAAAGAFGTLAFALRAPAPAMAEEKFSTSAESTAPVAVAPVVVQPAEFDTTKLSALLDERLAAAFAAADEKRRSEVAAAVAATTPPRAIEAAAVPAPAAGAKPRLGRGLLGLMNSPEALARSSTPAVGPESATAPAAEASEDQEPERAAA